MRERLRRLAARLGVRRGRGETLADAAERLRRLGVAARGLHRLTPGGPRFSVVAALPGPGPWLGWALDALLSLSAPDHELLLVAPAACRGEVERRLRELAGRARLLPPGQGLNEAVAASSGTHLVLLDQPGVLRPDALLRFEQLLGLLPDRSALYVRDLELADPAELGLRRPLRQPPRLDFPFVLSDREVGRLLVLPRAAWPGLRPELGAAARLDLLLRLDLAGVELVGVPVPLFGRPAGPLPDDPAGGLRALEEWAARRGLPWRFAPGLVPGAFRALPAAAPLPGVHAVLPFRDRKALTLAAARALLAQRGAVVHLTAVDDGSEDRSVAAELAALGAEVLRRDEPFHYSRLCNAGVRAPGGRGLPLVLLLNNDVVLDPGALEELARWAVQPGVGLVGCRLRYPGGGDQHAGVDHDWTRPYSALGWSQRPEGEVAAASIRAVEAVTAACAMVRREAFEAVGGLDEALYPIAYSDTDLSVRLRERGLACLYTPYAAGTHLEGATRGVAALEDFEGSRWLQELAARRRRQEGGGAPRTT